MNTRAGNICYVLETHRTICRATSTLLPRRAVLKQGRLSNVYSSKLPQHRLLDTLRNLSLCTFFRHYTRYSHTTRYSVAGTGHTSVHATRLVIQLAPSSAMVYHSHQLWLDGTSILHQRHPVCCPTGLSHSPASQLPIVIVTAFPIWSFIGSSWSPVSGSRKLKIDAFVISTIRCSLESNRCSD